MPVHPAGPRHADVLPEPGHAGPPADLSALDPQLWPASVTREPTHGALVVGGVDVRDVAEQVGTAAYLLDEVDVRTRMRAWTAAFAAGEVFYAAKALLTVDVARWAVDEGLSLDVATGGELAVALRAGVPGERLLLHGNNKSVDELAAALAATVRTVVVDSFDEIARLAFLAEARGVRQRVYLRVTTGVEAHTHEFIATAHEDQKFGLSLASGAAAEAVERILMLPALELVGLHSHIGSQIFDTAGFEVAARRVVGFAAQLRDAHGLVLPELDLGGGFGVPYAPGDDPLGAAEIAERLAGLVRRECEGAELAVPRLAVEPGRAVVATPGITLYTVGTVKDVDGLRTYVSVDGGMSDNVRPALYGAEHAVTLASRVSHAPPMLCRVVGKHCESGDVVVRDAWLPADLAPGDLLAVAGTGAYCRSMASSYNLVGRPPLVAVRDGDAQLLLRRETVDDLLALDCGADG